MLMASPLARASAAGRPESPGIPRAIEAAAAALGLVISMPLLVVAGVAVAAGLRRSRPLPAGARREAREAALALQAAHDAARGGGAAGHGGRG